MHSCVASAAEAKALGVNRYFTGKPCKSGHIAERWTLRSVCVECLRVSAARRYRANPEVHKSRVIDWCRLNPERLKANKAAYRDKNREALKRKSREYHLRKPEAATKSSASRRARKKRAQPHWVDPRDLQRFYDLANVLSTSTGVKHSVDHIVPLSHALVCGLHVPWNLQVMPLRENKRKSNRFEVET